MTDMNVSRTNECVQMTRGGTSGRPQGILRVRSDSRRCDSGFVWCVVQPLRADRMVGGVVDGKRDERAVQEHVRNIRATPSPGGRLDEGPAFVGVSDDSRRRGHVRDDRLLQVNNDVGVGFDVVDPVTSTVSPGHPGNEQLAVVVVQEDLDAPQLAGPPACRRQIDDLTVVQRGPGGFTQRTLGGHSAILSTEPPGCSPAGQGLCTHVNGSMARVSPYELGNVAAFVYEAAKGSPGEWSSPQPKCPSLAPQQGSGPDAAVRSTG